MTTVRIGARVGTVQEVLDWLHHNVGNFEERRIHFDGRGTDYFGENWTATWCKFGAGWFMDVVFDDPKHATFFTLRWK